MFSVICYLDLTVAGMEFCTINYDLVCCDVLQFKQTVVFVFDNFVQHLKHCMMRGRKIQLSQLSCYN